MASFFSGLREGFKEFGLRINSAVTFVVLFFVYLIGVGLTSLIGKITRKKFLAMDPGGDSYWIAAENSEDLEEYRRSF